MAGGFFSGGSSDAVNASVAEAEAAAREAEAARDAILDNQEVYGENSTNDSTKNYTVPLSGTDAPVATSFLNQQGDWTVPAGSAPILNLDDLEDVNITSPDDNDILVYNASLNQWGNEAIDPSDPLTGGTGITVTGNEISIADGGVGTNQLAGDAVTTTKIVNSAISSLKIAPGAVTANRIADGAVNATKLSATGTNGQLLSTNSGGSLEWVTPAVGTTYTASDGVQLVGEDFSLEDGGVVTAKLDDNAVDADKLNVTGDGTSGQILSSDGDGSFTWIDEGAADAYTAGTGLDLNGQEFSIADGGVDTTQIAGEAVNGSKLDATNSPTSGQFLTANLDNTFTWITPAAGTAYTAGTGLDLTGDEFSIADGGVDSAQIAANAVDADALNVTGDGTSGQFLASDGDGSFTWTASTNSLEGLTDTNIPAGGPSVRSFLEYNTNTDVWDSVAATELLAISELFDVDINSLANNDFLRYNSTDGRWENEHIVIPNGLSGGTGISIDSDVINIEDLGVDTTQLADGSVTNVKLGTGAVNSSKIFDGAITTSKILDSNVTAAKLGTIPISTLSDVNTSGVNNGQILTYDGTTWTPTDNNGGGNSDNSRLGIALAPTSLNQGDAGTSIAITLSISNPVNGTETISGQSVTVTDPNGHTVVVTGSENSWSFTADTTDAGNYVVRGSATFTLGGVTSVHTASANLPIHATNSDWYQAVTDTQPNSIDADGVVDNGIFTSPETGTWNRPSDDSDDSMMAYVILPTGSYTFHAGLLFATITDLGVVSTNYSLYRLDDFAQVKPGESRIITITEA